MALSRGESRPRFAREIRDKGCETLIGTFATWPAIQASIVPLSQWGWSGRKNGRGDRTGLPTKSVGYSTRDTALVRNPKILIAIANANV